MKVIKIDDNTDNKKCVGWNKEVLSCTTSLIFIQHYVKTWYT